MPQPSQLVERYVAMWNESDPRVRRAAVRELWTADGTQVLQPPREMLEEAARLGFSNPVLEARGHDELEARVTRSYEEFVAPGGFSFRPLGDVTQIGDVVKFRWEMTPVGGGAPAGVGLEFVIIDAAGRIRTDYQFIEQ